MLHPLALTRRAHCFRLRCSQTLAPVCLSVRSLLGCCLRRQAVIAKVAPSSTFPPSSPPFTMRRVVIALILVALSFSQAVTAAFPVCTGDFACDPAQSILVNGQNVCCPGLNNAFATTGSSCTGSTDCTVAATYLPCPHLDPACGGWAEPSYNGQSYCCPTTTTEPGTKNTFSPSRLQCTQPTQGVCGTTIDPCYYYTNCRSCASYNSRCGWCGANGACMDGNSAGSTDGSCSGSVWTYKYAQCPAPIDGGWSDWSTCSVSCTQSRTCSSPYPQNGGASCAGASSQACNTAACPAPVNGGWSDWGQCSDATCTQSRTCTNPASSNGGATCVGDASQACNTQRCTAGGGGDSDSSVSSTASNSPSGGSSSGSTYSASVEFTLKFNTAVDATLINTVQSSVATMAGVSKEQVQVAAASSASAASSRRLLQASSQLKVTILASSGSVAQAAYNQFQTAFTSTNTATNPLLSQGVDTTSSPVAVYSDRVTCTDGSTKASAADCNGTVNNAAASVVAFSWVSLTLGFFATLFTAARA